MSGQQSKNTYHRIRVDPSIEARMVSVLMDSGQAFSAISKTEYLISKTQCDALASMDIPYTKL